MTAPYNLLAGTNNPRSHMALMALAEMTKAQGVKRRVYTRFESFLYEAVKKIGDAFRRSVGTISEIKIAAPSANGAAFGKGIEERQEASPITDFRDQEDQAAPTTGRARR